MFESSCSNCDDIECLVRDYSYDCYKEEIKDIQQCMDSYDIELIKKIIDRSDILYKQTQNDKFYQFSYFGKQILDCFNGE